MYEPFFFGPEDRQLFGIYHPSLGADRRVLTLICPPLFSEFNRTHSALRKLAISLANAGHHVLRFDFAGTGDSHGNLEEFTLAEWEGDIVTALDEGREISGCERVRVLGVRGSCPLVCRSVSKHPAVDRFVFWDPILDGRQYLETLRQGQLAAIEFHVYISRAARKKIGNSYCVFQMSASMLKDFQALSAKSYSLVPRGKSRATNTSTYVIEAADGIQSEFIDFDCKWDVESEEVIMCQPVLESLMNQLLI